MGETPRNRGDERLEEEDVETETRREMNPVHLAQIIATIDESKPSVSDFDNEFDPRLAMMDMLDGGTGHMGL